MRVVALLLSLAFPLLGQEPKPFGAEWITAPTAPGHDLALLRLRKTFNLNEVPKHFIVHVSADNHYLLVVNGARVGDGPAIGDVQHWRYETYDLAPVLHSGENLIAATAWNLGDQAPIRQITSHLGFVLAPDSPVESVVATDKTWLTHLDTGLTLLPKPAELGDNYYVGSPGERLDGRELDSSWSDAAAATPAPAWQPAVSLGTAVPRGVHSESNSWLLVPDGLPPMEYTATTAGHLVRTQGLAAPSAFPDKPLTIPARSTVTLLLDRATLTTAYPTLTLSGGAGALVSLRYAEALIDADGNKGNRDDLAGKHLVGVADEFIPNGSRTQIFTPLDWRTWRFLELDVTTTDQPLTLQSLSATFTAFPFEHRAAFTSDDPTLARIWEVGWRTARACAHDAYMDTPYWERLQYVGDTRIQTQISYTNAGDDRLARQAITAFHDSLLPEGITQSRYPSRHLQVIQNFSLLWIAMLHDFWYMRDDPAFVAEQLPAMRSVLSYIRARRTPQGLPALRDWWPFVDWATGFPGGNSPSLDGVSAAGSLFYLQALRQAAELEQVLGDGALAQQDAQEADRLAATIHTRFWSPGDALLADTTALDHFSQQANALAVMLDVVPRTEQAELMNRLYSATDPGFIATRPLPANFSVASNYFRFYLTRALVHAGLGDRYLDTLGPWKTMLANGLSTWAEQPEPTRSDSHAWSAHPDIDLLTTVAGITPVAPGFSTIQIAPALGTLHHLAASYPSPRGEISVDYTVAGKGLHAQINLPTGLPATLLWNGRHQVLHSGANDVLLQSSHP